MDHGKIAKGAFLLACVIALVAVAWIALKPSHQGCPFLASGYYMSGTKYCIVTKITGKDKTYTFEIYEKLKAESPSTSDTVSINSDNTAKLRHADVYVSSPEQFVLSSADNTLVFYRSIPLDRVMNFTYTEGGGTFRIAVNEKTGDSSYAPKFTVTKDGSSEVFSGSYDSNDPRFFTIRQGESDYDGGDEFFSGQCTRKFWYLGNAILVKKSCSGPPVLCMASTA
jgi:hypothetical protein